MLAGEVAKLKKEQGKSGIESMKREIKETAAKGVVDVDILQQKLITLVDTARNANSPDLETFTVTLSTFITQKSRGADSKFLANLVTRCLATKVEASILDKVEKLSKNVSMGEKKVKSGEDDSAAVSGASAGVAAGSGQQVQVPVYPSWMWPQPVAPPFPPPMFPPRPMLAPRVPKGRGARGLPAFFPGVCYKCFQYGHKEFQCPRQ